MGAREDQIKRLSSITKLRDEPFISGWESTKLNGFSFSQN